MVTPDVSVPGPDAGASRAIPGSVVLLLLLALAIGVVGRAWVIQFRALPVHDESITLLQTSGQARAFPRSPHVGSWVAAAQWQALMATPPDSLREVALGLVEQDVHPPTYFAILALWQRVRGDRTLAAACALGIGFYLLGAIALVLTARRASLTWDATLAALALWSFSPAALDVAVQARPYGLMTALALWFVWVCLVSRDRRRPGWLLAVAVLSLAMGTTHYTLQLIAPLIALAVAFERPGLRCLAVPAAALAGSAFAELFFPPPLSDPLARLGETPASAGRLLHALVSQIFMTRSHTFEAYALPLRLLYGVALAVCVAVVSSAVLSWRNADGRPLVRVLVVLAGCAVGLWGFGVYPEHAMGNRYLALCTPVFALVVAAAVTSVGTPGFGRGVLAALVVVQLVGFLAAVAGIAARQQQDVHVVQARFDGCSHVVVDNVRRGILLPAIALLPPDVQVYAQEAHVLEAGPLRLPADVDTLCYLRRDGWGWTGRGDRDLMLSRLAEARRPRRTTSHDGIARLDFDVARQALEPGP